MCLLQKSVDVGVFLKWLGHFERKFQTEKGVVHQPLSVSETRVIALSCGIKISAVYCLVLSQSTRVKDKTDGQNYNSQDRASI